jgi:hypothetical protein
MMNSIENNVCRCSYILGDREGGLLAGDLKKQIESHLYWIVQICIESNITDLKFTYKKK